MRVLYAHTHSPSYVRCRKIIESFLRHGFEVTFFGAQRENSIEVDSKMVDELGFKFVKSNSIFPHGLRSFPALLRYLWQLRKYVKNGHYDLIVLTNEELVLSTLFVSTDGRFVLDAIDALDIRRRSFFPLKHISSFVTNWARKRVGSIWEVEDFRRDLRPRFSDKTVVLRNVPTQVGHYVANIVEKIQYIFAYGSLNQDVNGIEELLSAIEFVNTENKRELYLYVAGTINGSGLLKSLRESPFVKVLGCLSHQECMKMADNALALFAFYKDINNNFKYAAPNKVYEAFALGKQLIINRETLISRFCIEQEFGICCDYGDIAALRKLIMTLLTEDKSKRVEQEKLKQTFSREFSWDRFFENALSFSMAKVVISR